MNVVKALIANKPSSKSILMLLLFITTILGVGLRLYYLDKHFAHVDDIAVAATILKNKSSQDFNQMLDKIYDKTDLKYSSSKFELSRRLNDYHLLELGFKLKEFVCVPLSTTYAPLQFLLTALLIHPDQNYQQLLFWGRFPSFLFFVISFILLLFFIHKWFGKDSAIYLLLGTLLLSFSWENIIYSMQMESYSIGVAAGIGMILLMLYVSRTQHVLSLNQSTLIGFALALLFTAQYQILLFIPAFFASMAWVYRNQLKQGLFKKLLVMLASFIATSFPTYFLFFRHVASRGINWNAGPHGEFVFSGGSLIQSVGFFLKNSFLIIQSNLLMFSEASILFWALSILFTILILIGIWNLIRSLQEEKRMLAWFFLISVGTLWILVLSGKLALSPTRHMLIYQPMLILLVLEGAFFIQSFLKKDLKKVTIWLGSGIILAFLLYLPGIMQNRLDPFNPQVIKTLLEKYKVNFVISYDSTVNIYLMKKDLGSKIRAEYADWGDVAPSKVNGRVAFLSHRSPFSLRNAKKLYEKNITSNTEVDFLNKTKNGSNGFYLAIYEI